MIEQKTVTIYTATGCPHCAAAKDYLEEHDIQYTERNIAEDPDAAKELSDKGVTSTPTLLIGEDMIVGFDRDRVQEALES